MAPTFLILGSFALGSIALWIGFAAHRSSRLARRRADRDRGLTPVGAAAGPDRNRTAALAIADSRANFRCWNRPDIRHAVLTWAISALATAGVIMRPFVWPEAIWAVAGAVLLVALRADLRPRTRWPASPRAPTSICS